MTMQKKTSHIAKVALITGAARRIGAEIACILHENGMNVVLHYHFSEKEAKKLCHHLNQKRTASAAILKSDLSHTPSLKKLIYQSVKIWGRLDALVNNASSYFKTTLGHVTESSWGTLINTNLKAPFFLSQEAAPHLAKKRGCIVNIVDIHSARPMKKYPVYSISKAGLLMLTRTLAIELGPRIRVNAVSPGAIMWPEGKNSLSTTLKKEIIRTSILKQHGTPGDIAKAVLFLIRDAGYITGIDMAVDGGRSLVMP